MLRVYLSHDETNQWLPVTENERLIVAIRRREGNGDNFDMQRSLVGNMWERVLQKYRNRSTEAFSVFADVDKQW